MNVATTRTRGWAVRLVRAAWSVLVFAAELVRLLIVLLVAAVFGYRAGQRPWS